MKASLSVALMILLWFVFASSASHAADFLGDAIKILLPDKVQQIAQEEAKIRTNPLARTTDLLKKVLAK